MRTNTFVTTSPHLSNTEWTINNGFQQMATISYSTFWDSRNFAGTAILKAGCFSYNKTVPIYFPQAVPKISGYVVSAAGAFSISEVMPSIVTNEASINIEATKEGYFNVAIYDMEGKKLMNVVDEYVNADNETKISLNNLSGLSSGMYTVVITSGDDMAVRKFMKQ